MQQDSLLLDMHEQQQIEEAMMRSLSDKNCSESEKMHPLNKAQLFDDDVALMEAIQLSLDDMNKAKNEENYDQMKKSQS